MRMMEAVRVMVLAEADDYDPSDVGARKRSDQAKIDMALAQWSWEHGHYELAALHVEAAMRTLEGN